MGPHDRRRWADEEDTDEQQHSPLVPRVCCKWSQQCNLSWWIEKLNLSFPARLPVPSHIYKFSLFYCQCDSTSLLPLYFSSTAAAPQFGNLRPYTPSSYPLSRYSSGRVLTASISYTASSSVGNAKFSFVFSLCPSLNVEGRLTVLSPNALPLLWTLVEASSFASSTSEILFLFPLSLSCSSPYTEWDLRAGVQSSLPSSWNISLSLISNIFTDRQQCWWIPSQHILCLPQLISVPGGQCRRSRPWQDLLVTGNV